MRLTTGSTLDAGRGPEYNHSMLARNATRGTVLAEDVRVARSWWARLRGLMLSPPMPRGQGLLIERCRSIHTHFMRFAMDALFLDEEGSAVAVVKEMRPWRIGRYYRGARDVLELPAGVLSATATQVGDRIRLE